MKKRTILLLFSLQFLIFACGSETSSDQIETAEEFLSTKTLIDSTHPPIDTSIFQILDKLQICTLSDTVQSIAPCKPELFRVFPFRTEKKLSDAFIVEMVPGLYGSPVHQLVLVENYLGKYRIVNQYLGYLIEMKTTISGYNDLLIGYTDPDIGIVAIRHEWQGSKYDVVDVEEINHHFVKPEFKDSINAIFLPAFAGGH
jgi:hypothetical protein